MRVPENVYRGELVSYPGAWSFQIGKSAVIFVSDKELEALADPDRVLNLTLTFEKQEASLRQVCERAQAAGHRTLILAFDHFFSQYRPGQEGPRKYMPDMDAYVQRIAKISRFVAQYGLGLELSLLSPLEMGNAYMRQTGEAGVWMQYRKGVRDPRTGYFNVSLWRQLRWANNKGIISLKEAGIRVFAFKATPVGKTQYHAVDPRSIVEITDSFKVTLAGKPAPTDDFVRVTVSGKGHIELGDRDRVLVVQQYQTPEMDYFSPKALPFLTKLVDKYADAGIKLNALYSDEMHIQQNWIYHRHHDNGEFALRYVSPHLAKRFAELYGAEYADFAKYLLYFAYGQEDGANDLYAKERVIHVFGNTPEEIQKTALFRANYYHLLQEGVVDLFTSAKHHAENRYGYLLEARAHATWAESPTIDFWRTGRDAMYPHAYEYTSNFLWSNTVHQASSACYDYFKWGDFLTGNGNDHAECGYLDRNYVGLALACSIGILNEIPYAYAAHWGMPDAIARRRTSLVNTYGAAGSPLYGMVQEMQHRDIDVLMLYPLDLVAVEERFGSWMTQYGYANLITQQKLLERGKVIEGGIEIAGRHFSTLVLTFEPFPSPKLFSMIREMVASGGRVIWSAKPPLLSSEGKSVLKAWQEIFGVENTPEEAEGKIASGCMVTFEGALQGVSPQTILTDFLVDYAYPVRTQEGTTVLARCRGEIVGTEHKAQSGGRAIFLGFRPRDDQSASLGYVERHWFDILTALGAYSPTEKIDGMNDNTEYISRTTNYLACRFPNGAIALSRHLTHIEERWEGGFARNAKADTEYLKKFPPPSEEIHLENFAVNGQRVTYKGSQAVTFRLNAEGNLIAFAGSECQSITLNEKETVFADRVVNQIAWAPVAENRRVAQGALLQIMLYGEANLTLPAGDLPKRVGVFAEGKAPGSRGVRLTAEREQDVLRISVPKAQSGRWLYVVAE